jgi:beta-phosphoglucomutase
MLEGVIFDMDGVLIDSHPAHRNAWRKFLLTVDKTVDDQELDFILEGRRREEILKYFLGDLPATTIDEYGHRKDQLYEENFDEVKLIPGVCAFLEALERAGLRTGIATSASRSRTSGTLSRLHLDQKFADLATGDDVLVGKPDPAVYRLISERLKIPPDRLVVLEDSPCGIQAARAAGMWCIGVATNGRTEALRLAGAAHVVPDFVNLSVEELLELWKAHRDHYFEPCLD